MFALQKKYFKVDVYNHKAVFIPSKYKLDGRIKLTMGRKEETKYSIFLHNLTSYSNIITNNAVW